MKKQQETTVPTPTLDLLEVQKILCKKAERVNLDLRAAVISDAKVHIDGNMTLVTVWTPRCTYIGWSKFNPADVRITARHRKNGTIAFQRESKYDPMVGVYKALDRALDQMIQYEK